MVNTAIYSTRVDYKDNNIFVITCEESVVYSVNGDSWNPEEDTQSAIEAGKCLIDNGLIESAKVDPSVPF
jgi:hypothetical protein